MLSVSSAEHSISFPSTGLFSPVHKQVPRSLYTKGLATGVNVTFTSLGPTYSDISNPNDLYTDFLEAMQAEPQYFLAQGTVPHVLIASYDLDETASALTISTLSSDKLTTLSRMSHLRWPSTTR